MQAAYDSIYFELKQLIEDGTYAYKSLLPSETVLVSRYGCAHNTVRKALSLLAANGYVQPIHGKGVRVIWLPFGNDGNQLASHTSSGIESFEEAAVRCGFEPGTKVLLMERQTITPELSAVTYFDKGQSTVHLERVRTYNNIALSWESSHFREDIVRGMTRSDAESSVYNYIESVRNELLVTCRRCVTLEHANERDKELLRMDGADYVAVIHMIAFDRHGLLCEHTELRLHPSVFKLEQTVLRSRLNDYDKA